MTVSERIPFSGLLLPLQEGHTYSCDRCTTLHLKRAATDRFFLFRMTKPCVTLTGEMCLWEDAPHRHRSADAF